MASPTSPTVAFRIGERTDDPLAMYLADVCTIPVSLAGLPAHLDPVRPVGGLPVGLQLVGAGLQREAGCCAPPTPSRTTIGFDPRPPELELPELSGRAGGAGLPELTEGHRR